MPKLDSLIHKNAFTFGCVQPDYNKLSYLKGFSARRNLKGHTYNSSSSYISETAEKLQNKGNWTLWDYYRLGKVMHYLSDSFTYPHNEDFCGTFAEHREHEAQLHLLYADCLEQYDVESSKDYPENIGEYVAVYHRQYMFSAGDVNTDAEFITRAANQVMGALVQCRTRASNEKPYEGKMSRAFTLCYTKANVFLNRLALMGSAE